MSIGKACQALGHEVIMNDKIITDVDLAFVFATHSPKNPTMERSQIILPLREAKVPTFHIDSSFFGTYIRNALNAPETGMFRIGLNESTGEADWLIDHVSHHRFDEFKRKFKFEEQYPRLPNDYPIMILGQPNGNFQYDDKRTFDTYVKEEIMPVLLEKTDRVIIFRQHPMVTAKPNLDGVDFQKADRARRTLLKDMLYCSAVVTHSSSGAVEALVEGLPTFATSPRCIAYEACGDLNDIVEPFDWSKREKAMWKWAHTTWSIEEFANPELIDSYIQRAKDKGYL
jgi:hypothetical protein|tara:strand:- start:552 stop:1406 length:855 start_codon:yes stop_codon:yes gene_type:complete